MNTSANRRSLIASSCLLGCALIFATGCDGGAPYGPGPVDSFDSSDGSYDDGSSDDGSYDDGSSDDGSSSGPDDGDDGGVVQLDYHATSLLAGLSTTSRLAVRNGYVYVIDWSADELLRVATDGSTVETIATGDGYETIATTATHVYWGGYQGLHRAKLDGSNHVLVDDAGEAMGIAIDDSNVYYVIDSLWDGTELKQAPLSNPSNATTLHNLGTTLLDIDNIAVDGSHVYWANANNDTINRIPIGGGAVQELVANVTLSTDCQSFAAAGAELVWKRKHYAYAAPKTGGAAQEFIDADATIKSVVADDTYVYFGGYHDVYRVPIAGGPVQVVIENYRCETMALDGQRVYCATGSSVYRFDPAN